MATITAAAALATLTAAGRVAVQRPAPAGTCRTLCYRVDGQPVNLSRLREMAREAMAAPAPAPAAPVEPAPAPADPAAAALAHIAHKFSLAPSQMAAHRAAAAALQDAGRAVTVRAILQTVERPLAAAPAARRPTLPGEPLPPLPPAHPGPAPTLPTLPTLRADAAAGRPVSLAALSRAISDDRAAARAAHPGPVGMPWDPGTPDARARVGDQGARVAILWAIAQAARGAGVALPASWASDGPAMAGEWPLPRALAVVSSDVLRAAAVALAALPPVTTAQADALALCRAALSQPGRA